MSAGQATFKSTQSPCELLYLAQVTGSKESERWRGEVVNEV